MQVTRSTDRDLEQVLAWLRDEYDEEQGAGFWANREMIRRAHTGEEDRFGEVNELWVVREANVAVAFQVGRYSPEITCVRDDRKGRGYGTALFQAGLARAMAYGATRLVGQCSPESSLTFWLKMGFRQTGENGGLGFGVPVEMLLPRSLPLPTGDKIEVDVELAVLPEDVLYGAERPPLVQAAPQAAIVRDTNRVHLAERFLIPDGNDATKDAALLVRVDGEELYFDKAKYREAEEMGVRYDPLPGGLRYLDFIDLPAV